MSLKLHQTALVSSRDGWKLRFTYRVFAPAALGSGLDAVRAGPGVGADALVPLCTENKEMGRESSRQRLHGGSCGTPSGWAVRHSEWNMKVFPLGSMRRDAKTEPLDNRIISLSPQRRGRLIGKSALPAQDDIDKMVSCDTIMLLRGGG